MNNVITQYLKKHGFERFCPKAVLFDMDGVIYDSMKYHSVSWHQAMEEFGLDMPYEGAYIYEGMRGVEVIKKLTREQWHRDISGEEALRMYDAKRRIFSESPRPCIMPGIKELMQQIKKESLKICVVTGSGQSTMLERLLHDFEGLVSPGLVVNAFDVKRGKPHPEPYLKGMMKCNTEPWQTIVVENAPLGVEAAVAAGSFTIAVNTGPLPDKTLAAKGANLIFPSMSALSKEWKTFRKEWT